MKILSIILISQAGDEGEAIVTDGQFEITCFAHPMQDREEGNIVDGHLQVLGADHFALCGEAKMEASKNHGYWGYRLSGVIDSLSPAVVLVGGLKLELDIPIPDYLKKQDWITFTCDRIDLPTLSAY